MLVWVSEKQKHRATQQKKEVGRLQWGNLHNETRLNLRQNQQKEMKTSAVSSCLRVLAGAASGKAVLQKPSREAEHLRRKGYVPVVHRERDCFPLTLQPAVIVPLPLLNGVQTFRYTADLLPSFFFQPCLEKLLLHELFLCWKQPSAPSTRFVWPTTRARPRQTVGFLLWCVVMGFKKGEHHPQNQSCQVWPLT